MIFSSNYVLLNGYKLGNIRIVTAVAVVAVVVVTASTSKSVLVAVCIRNLYRIKI